MKIRTRVKVIDGEPPHPCREAFVKPELAPPIHGDKVAEPLVSKFVGYDVSHPVSVSVGGSLGVEKHGSGSVKVRSDETMLATGTNR